jgi:hypothetical protein
MTVFRSSKLEIDLVDPGKVLVSAKDYRLARKLSRLTGRYLPYVHKPGEEGLYTIGLSLWAKTAEICFGGYLSPELAVKIDSWLKSEPQLEYTQDGETSVRNPGGQS